MIIQEDLDAAQIAELTRQVDPRKEAVNYLLSHVIKKGFDALIESRLNNTHPQRDKFKMLIKSMPSFNLSSLLFG